jgi:hypothetical protein
MGTIQVNPVILRKRLIPLISNKIIFESGWRGLTQSKDIPEEFLIRVIEFVHKLPNNTYDNDVIDLIKHNPTIWINNNILEILIEYALTGQVDTRIESEEKAIEREVTSVASLTNTYGEINCGESNIRGKSWRLLGEVLEKHPDIEEQIYQAFDNALNNENLISVRCCMLSILISFFNINKKRFPELMQRLTGPTDTVAHSNNSQYLSPLISYSAIRLFPYVFRDFPELANDLVSKLLECDDHSKRLIGAWLIFGESFQDSYYADWADNLALINVEHRRLLASVTSGALKWTEYRHRAENILKTYLFDEDEQVIINAAEFLRHVDAIDEHRELISDFIKSPALLDKDSMLFHVLEDTNCNVLDFVIQATKRMLAEIAHDKKSDRHDINLYSLKTLLKREYVSSETNPQARKHILDFIDYMLEHNIYGVDDIVTSHDRW